MSLLRRRCETEDKQSYICGAYRNNSTVCSSHYIRSNILEKIILENIRDMTSFVASHEDEFIKMVLDMDAAQKNKGLAKKKRSLAEKKRRVSELDDLFIQIYEDNVNGKLSDERFESISERYEDEQSVLKQEIEKLSEEVGEEEKKTKDVSRFISVVKKYIDIREITLEILHEFIDKIIVHEADKSNGHRQQEIEIVYNHVGALESTKILVPHGNAKAMKYG